jgi:hypothetical protein
MHLTDQVLHFAIELQSKTHRIAFWRLQLRWFLQFCIQSNGALAFWRNYEANAKFKTSQTTLQDDFCGCLMIRKENA